MAYDPKDAIKYTQKYKENHAVKNDFESRVDDALLDLAIKADSANRLILAGSVAILLVAGLAFLAGTMV